MTGKIFRNSFLVGIFVLLICSLLFSAVLVGNFEEQLFEQLSGETAVLSAAVHASGASCLDGLADEDESVTIFAPDGTIVYESAPGAAEADGTSLPPEAAQAAANGTGKRVAASAASGRTYYYARKMADNHILRVASSQAPLFSMLRVLLAPIAWVIILVVMLCGVMAFRLAKQITRPINAINVDDPTASDAYQELEPLIARLQDQMRTIRRQMEELSLRQREFTAITENMREGFLLLDSKGAILSGNHSAMQLLHVPPGQENGDLPQLDPEPEVMQAIGTALSGGRAELLLSRQNSTWQIIASAVRSGEQTVGAVLLLMDVTEREQRDALRREFSANVSHELKTPLTSICGFAELMQAGLVTPDKIQEFSGDIYRESRRLLDLVNDIIKLSRLDESDPAFVMQPVALWPLAERVLESLRPVAQKRGITMELTGIHTGVRGVEQLLNEMLYNLCDNAIKYNQDGGSVTVSFAESGAGVVMCVSDTGIGIPYAHQNRVFERFYRVDKSHSKALGGTGLGLSIVKHAAQYHGARLELKSEEGRGTAVSVYFPERCEI